LEENVTSTFIAEEYAKTRNQHEAGGKEGTQPASEPKRKPSKKPA
jgi:hypothetical protein